MKSKVRCECLFLLANAEKLLKFGFIFHCKKKTNSLAFLQKGGCVYNTKFHIGGFDMKKCLNAL